MIVAYVTAFALLVAAIAMAIVRVERGPSMFDRILAVDVNAAAVLGIVAVTAAATKRTDLVPVLVALALIGFIYSVSVARFAVVESPEDARILSKEELREMQQEQPDDDAPPVHDVDEGGTAIAVVDLPREDEEGTR